MRVQMTTDVDPHETAERLEAPRRGAAARGAAAAPPRGVPGVPLTGSLEARADHPKGSLFDRRERVNFQPASTPARLEFNRLGRRRTVRLSPLPGAVYEGAAFSPRGDALAIVTRRRRQSSLTVRGRVLFTGTGSIGAPVWSPDGDWVLVRWGPAKRWVAVRAFGAPRLETLARTGEPLGGCCPPMTR